MFFFGISDSTAHTVSQNNEVTWNQWRLQNGKKVQGNFLYSKGDSLFFITPSDLVQQIHINQLIKQDQLLAKLKIEQYHAQIQQSNVQTTFHFSATEEKNRNRDGYMLAFLFLLLGGLSLAFRIQSTLVTKTGRLFAAGCGILLLFSFFPHREIIFQTDPAFLSNAFAPYRNWVQTRYDDDYFYVSSQGIPQHPMMVGIRSWQSQVPLPQPYTGANSWSIPLHPQWVDTPISTRNNFFRGAIAIAVNGIPVFNALNNRGEDALLAGELDQWGGHCGRADDYHYHLVPEHLANNNAALPLAFALDGFPIYGKQEPDGSKLKKLDECNGHSENDTFYHYHAISSYPYAIGAFRGKVQMDAKARAPENQIIPQAFTKPIRPPGKPLRGAVIQDFSLTAPNEYSLIYQLANQQGKIRYRWNKESVSFFYSYPDGSSDSATYFIRK